MKVINFFAGPGAGKSTTAAGLFFLMKTAGYRVELVTEYAKDLTYERSLGVMQNQLALLGEQDRRLQRLVGTVDVAITDSPLLMGLVYAKDRYTAPWFRTAVEGAFDSYDNFNVFVHAVKPYQPWGRRQSEESARALDGPILELLAGRPRTRVSGNEDAPQILFDLLKSKLKEPILWQPT